MVQNNFFYLFPFISFDIHIVPLSVSCNSYLHLFPAMHLLTFTALQHFLMHILQSVSMQKPSHIFMHFRRHNSMHLRPQSYLHAYCIFKHTFMHFRETLSKCISSKTCLCISLITYPSTSTNAICLSFNTSISSSFDTSQYIFSDIFLGILVITSMIYPHLLQHISMYFFQHSSIVPFYASLHFSIQFHRHSSGPFLMPISVHFVEYTSTRSLLQISMHFLRCISRIYWTLYPFA
jgi:hypothetical protein